MRPPGPLSSVDVADRRRAADEPPDERLVDDRDLLAGHDVVSGHVAPAEQADAVGLEPARRDAVEERHLLRHRQRRVGGFHPGVPAAAAERRHVGDGEARRTPGTAAAAW